MTPPAPSRNLVQYGPVSGLSTGDAATVNDDGTLNVTGIMMQASWAGIKWQCDITRFTRGSTFTISADGLPENTEVIVRFDDMSDEAHSFIYPSRNNFKAGGVVPADAKSVFMALRRYNLPCDMTSPRVAIMVNAGDAVLPFERPDVTDAVGGAMS